MNGAEQCDCPERETGDNQVALFLIRYHTYIVST
jgi:hypothetical protein